MGLTVKLNGTTNYKIDNKNLVAYYKLNGNAYDSINSNNGTVTNNQYVIGYDGKLESATKFNGTSSKIDFGVLDIDTTLATGTFSICFWFKPIFDPTQMLLSLGANEILNINYATGSKIRVNYRDESLSILGFDTPTNTITTDKKWHHIVVTFDKGDLNVYIDNVLKGNTTISSLIQETKQLHLGYRKLNNDYGESILDNIRIYSNTLTVDEITKIYEKELENKVTLNNELLTYYKFNNNYLDITGNKYDLIANNGVSLGIDRYGNSNSCVTIDGTNASYLRYNGNIINNINQYSFSIWFKSNGASIPSIYQYIVTYSGLSTSVFFGLTLNYSTKELTFIDYEGDLGNFIYTINENEWVHIAFTIDSLTTGGIGKYYINGKKVGENTLTGNITENTAINYLTLGNYIGNNRPLNGNIDDFKVYNRELSEKEVFELYNENDYSVTTEGLKIYYPLVEDSNDHYNGYDLDITNNVTIDSNGAYFNGSTSYLKLNQSPIYAYQDFTVSMWVRVNDPTTDMSLISFTDTSVINTIIYGAITNTASKIRLDSYAPSGGHTEYSYNTNTDNWINITLQKESNNYRAIYINGSLAIRNNLETYNGGEFKEIIFGKDIRSGVDQWSFKGWMKNIRIYNRVLSSDEILNIYNYDL